MDKRVLLKKLKRLAKERGLRFAVTNEGKGGHKRVYVGDRWTTLTTADVIVPWLLGEMLKQLNLTRHDLE